MPTLRAACTAGKYSPSSAPADNWACILSMAGMTIAGQGVSLENSNVTVLNIYPKDASGKDI